MEGAGTEAVLMATRRVRLSNLTVKVPLISRWSIVSGIEKCIFFNSESGLRQNVKTCQNEEAEWFGWLNQSW